MVEAPTDFVNSLHEAEIAAFHILCLGTASVQGRNAFIHDQIMGADTWSFRLTEPAATDASYWNAHDFPTMAYFAELNGFFSQRIDAQRLVMQIVQSLPVNEQGIIVYFRMREVDEVISDLLQLHGEEETWAGWRVSVLLDVVFNTGGKMEFTE